MGGVTLFAFLSPETDTVLAGSPLPKFDRKPVRNWGNDLMIFRSGTIHVRVQ
jgi:hypothetical protein